MPDNIFNTDFSQTVDKIISRYDKYILIGDLNFDMLNSSKSGIDRGLDPRRIKSQRFLNWYLLLLRYARGRASESGSCVRV